MVHVSESKQFLALDQLDGFTYYELEITRGKSKVKEAIQRPVCEIFKGCDYLIDNHCILLNDLTAHIPGCPSPMCHLTERWIREHASFDLQTA